MKASLITAVGVFFFFFASDGSVEENKQENTRLLEVAPGKHTFLLINCINISRNKKESIIMHYR